MDELYNLIYKEQGSRIVAAQIVVEDANQEDMRVYTLNEYGSFECYKIK